MGFDYELDFEEALIKLLKDNGWTGKMLNYPTEAQLIKNWAEILFNNNKGIDRLNGHPLTDGEMQQILGEIKDLRTPLALNGFINGKSVSITRDNPADTLHFGKEVSLTIYNRLEIASGRSFYQIARQPKFERHSQILPKRRGEQGIKDVRILMDMLAVTLRAFFEVGAGCRDSTAVIEIGRAHV